MVQSKLIKIKKARKSNGNSKRNELNERLSSYLEKCLFNSIKGPTKH